MRASSPGKELWTADNRGLLFNLLFALYCVALAPQLSNLVDLQHPNPWLALPGILIYAGEGFAFFFKLKMVRLRAWQALHESGSADELPRPGCLALYALIMRMVIRIAFFAVSLMFLLNRTTEKEDPLGFLGIFMIVVVLGELVLMVIAMDRSRMLPPDQKRPWRAKEEAESEQAWVTKNLPRLNSADWQLKEQLSDMLLFIYASMMYTAVIDPMVDSGKEFVEREFHAGASALSTGLLLLFVLLVMSLFAFMPIRLSYWIEESLRAFTKQQRRRYILSYIAACLAAASPALAVYVRIYFL